MCAAFAPHWKPSLMNGSRTRYWLARLLKNAQMWRCSRRTVPPIRIGGTVLREQRHICAFFNSRANQYRVLLPFIKDGFQCGAKAAHIVDPGRRNEHVQRLCLAGIEVAS